MIVILRSIVALIGVAVFSLPVSHNDCMASGKKTVSKEKLIFSANVRFRYEFQDHYNLKYYGDNPKQGDQNDGFLLGRFRLGVDYNPTENIHIAVWGQHAQVWDYEFNDEDFYNGLFGQEHNPCEDNFELYTTYLEFKNILNQPLALKAGRQIIAYGDNRIFGPGQWGNSGKWIWDAIKLSYTFDAGFMDIFYGETMLHEPNEFSLSHGHGFKSFGFYAHYELPQKALSVALEPFFMTKDNDRDYYKGENGRPGDFNSYYYGIRIFRNNLNGFDFDATYIGQKGDFADDDIDAYGYHVLLAYKLKKVAFKPGISVEYSYASGDGNSSDNTHETFDGAFGARDKMYGRMNLFHWKNLKDAQVNLEVKPKKRFYLKLEYHQFWLADKKDGWYLNAKEYRDKTGNSGDKVGREFDITGKIKLPQGHVIQLGYGHFWPDEFAENQASHKDADWIFLQWSYNFSHGLM